MDYTVKTMDDLTGMCKPSSSQVCYQICPVCKDNRWKFYIDPESGKWFCFSGSHYDGGILEVRLNAESSYTEQILNIMYPPTVEDIEYKDIFMPPFKHLSDEANEYLLMRNVSEVQIQSYRMVEQLDEPRIIIPFTEYGVITYWTARAYSTTGGPKYVYPTGIDRRLFFTHRKDQLNLVIVEGVFDALAVEVAGYSAVALGGKTITDAMAECLMEHAYGYEHVAIMLDADALGDAIQLKTELELAIGGGDVLIRPCTAKDPGSMFPGEIREVIGY